jgi:hypothetical protein
MIFDFTAKVLFSYESEKSGENIAESFTNFLQGLMSIPLNIPGTAFHRCLKVSILENCSSSSRLHSNHFCLCRTRRGQ